MRFDDGEQTTSRFLDIADWALAQWDDFPVDASPRPLVMVESASKVGGGFRTGSAKIAYHRGLIDPHVDVPERVLALLRDRANPNGAETQEPEPLVITFCEHGEAEFETDRGYQVFPAWGLQGPEIVGVLWVLDPEVVDKAWRRGVLPRPVSIPGRHFYPFASWVEGDDLTLHFRFSGAPEEYERYPVTHVRESTKAVAVVPVPEDIGPPGPRRFVGQIREGVVRFQARLGARVLVNIDASPVAVTMGAPRDSWSARSGWGDGEGPGYDTHDH